MKIGKELEKSFGKKWKVKTAFIIIFLLLLFAFSAASILNNQAIIGLLGLVLGIVVLLLAVMIAVKRKGRQGTDYRAFFILGMSFTTIGIATSNFAFTGLGIVYMMIGLANRNKWKKTEIKNKKLVYALLGITLLAVMITMIVKLI